MPITQTIEAITTESSGGGGGGTIMGTIASPQIAFGTAPNTIGGSNNLEWNNGSQILISNGSILANGNTGPTPISGASIRFMWIAAHAAIRAGQATGGGWDDASIGPYSAGFGSDTVATAICSLAQGFNTTVSGNYSCVFGENNTVSGTNSLASGFNNIVSGNFGFVSGDGNTLASDNGVISGVACSVTGGGNKAAGAFGESHTVNGAWAYALGYNHIVQTQDSFAAGHAHRINAGTQAVFAGGYEHVVNSTLVGAFALGQFSTVNGTALGAIGETCTASGDHAIAMGTQMTVSGSHSFGINLSATPASFSNNNTFGVYGGISSFQGGQAAKRTAVAADYTVLNTDYILGIDTSALRTLTLPAVSAVPFQIYHFVDEGGNAGILNVTINLAGGDNIRGLTSFELKANYEVISIYNDGANTWFVLNSYNGM